MALSRSRAVAGATLVVVLAFTFGSNVTFAPALSELASHSTLTVVEGDVLVSRHGEDFSAARVGDVVAAGDTIRTGARASAEITYFQGSSVRLEPGRELVVARLATGSHGGTVLGMMKTIGRTWYVVSELISGGSRYEVRTPSATASVRG